MISNAEVEEFDDRDLALLAAACDLVAGFPRGEWRCHEVSRAVAAELNTRSSVPLRVVDGKFGRADHSWLAYEGGPDRTLRILDVYAVAALPQVRLLYAGPMNPGHSAHYVPSHLPRADIREDDIRKLRLLE